MRGDPADPLTAVRSLRDFVSWIIMLYNHNRELRLCKLPGNCLWQVQHQHTLSPVYGHIISTLSLLTNHVGVLHSLLVNTMAF